MGTDPRKDYVLHPNEFQIKVLATFLGMRLRRHEWRGDPVKDTPHDHRAFSKMVSRQEDQDRLDAGEVTTEELQRENSFFRCLKFRLTGIGGKKL